MAPPRGTFSELRSVVVSGLSHSEPAGHRMRLWCPDKAAAWDVLFSLPWSTYNSAPARTMYLLVELRSQLLRNSCDRPSKHDVYA